MHQMFPTPSVVMYQLGTKQRESRTSKYIDVDAKSDRSRTVIHLGVRKDSKKPMHDLVTPLKSPEVLKPTSQDAKPVRSSSTTARVRYQLAMKRLEQEHKLAMEILEEEERRLAEVRAIQDKEREIRMKEITAEQLYVQKLPVLEETAVEVKSNNECNLLCRLDWTRKWSLDQQKRTVDSRPITPRKMVSYEEAAEDDDVDKGKGEDLDGDDAEDFGEEESLNGIPSRFTSPRPSELRSTLPMTNPPPRPVSSIATGEGELLLTAGQIAAEMVRSNTQPRPVWPSATGAELILTASQMFVRKMTPRPDWPSATGKEKLIQTVSQVTAREVHSNPPPRPASPSAAGKEYSLTASQLVIEKEANPLLKPVLLRAADQKEFILTTGQITARVAGQVIPERWAICFSRRFELPNKKYGALSVDQLIRLRDCLQGETRREAVTKLMVPKSALPTVENLSQFYERPQMLKDQIEKASKLKSLVEHEVLGEFDRTVVRFCDELSAIDNSANSALDDLVGKFPAVQRLQEVGHQRACKQSTLKKFGEFMDALVADTNSRVKKSKPEKGKQGEKGHTDAQSSDGERDSSTCQPCPAHGEADYCLWRFKRFLQTNLEPHIETLKKAEFYEFCLWNYCKWQYRPRVRWKAKGCTEPLLLYQPKAIPCTALETIRGRSDDPEEVPRLLSWEDLGPNEDSVDQRAIIGSHNCRHIVDDGVFEMTRDRLTSEVVVRATLLQESKDEQTSRCIEGQFETELIWKCNDDVQCVGGWDMVLIWDSVWKEYALNAFEEERLANPNRVWYLRVRVATHTMNQKDEFVWDAAVRVESGLRKMELTNGSDLIRSFAFLTFQESSAANSKEVRMEEKFQMVTRCVICSLCSIRYVVHGNALEGLRTAAVAIVTVPFMDYSVVTPEGATEQIEQVTEAHGDKSWQTLGEGETHRVLKTGVGKQGWKSVCGPVWNPCRDRFPKCHGEQPEYVFEDSWPLQSAYVCWATRQLLEYYSQREQHVSGEKYEEWDWVVLDLLTPRYFDCPSTRSRELWRTSLECVKTCWYPADPCWEWRLKQYLPIYKGTSKCFGGVPVGDLDHVVAGIRRKWISRRQIMEVLRRPDGRVQRAAIRTSCIYGLLRPAVKLTVTEMKKGVSGAWRDHNRIHGAGDVTATLAGRHKHWVDIWWADQVGVEREKLSEQKL